jgi:hypothetical protein
MQMKSHVRKVSVQLFAQTARESGLSQGIPAAWPYLMSTQRLSSAWETWQEGEQRGDRLAHKRYFSTQALVS